MLASAGKGLSGFNLDGFFQVGHEERSFHRLEALEGCNLFDLHISLYFGTTATHLGMAHTGIFEDFFPEMMRRLAGGAITLTLWIQDISLELFEELDVVQSYLYPRGLKYVLLPHLGPSRYERTRRGNLLFEWPLGSLDEVVDRWFMCPQVSIEGYISTRSILGELSMLYFQPDTEERIRQLLRTRDFGFQLWQDLNGLRILSDKMSQGELARRLDLPDFNALVRWRASSY